MGWTGFPHIPALNHETWEFACFIFPLLPILKHIYIYWHIKGMKVQSKKMFNSNPNLKFMDQVRETLRYFHYAYRTEQTYCDWIKLYLKCYGMKRHQGRWARRRRGAT
jgi:Na+/H+ antiporter NhaB